MTSIRKGKRRFAFAVAALLATTTGCWAAGCSGDGPSGGILGIDRCDEFEARGIFSRANQKRLDNAVILGVVGTALWQGTETNVGRTAWKSLDAMVITAVTTEAMKNVFQRPRPSQSDNPNLWRQGAGHKSFPSGEVAMMAAAVTPVVREWQGEAPAVWSLSLLPIYMAKARTGSQAHWLSDVLVGGSIGVAVGLYAADRRSPLILMPTGDGIFVGFGQRF